MTLTTSATFGLKCTLIQLKLCLFLMITLALSPSYISNTKTQQAKTTSTSSLKLQNFEINSQAKLYSVLVDTLKDSLLADLFTRVATIETGHQLNSNLCNNTNNLFGFSGNCYKGADIGYKCFNTRLECVSFLSKWINRNPPKNTKTLKYIISWLKTRNYNPNKSYYKELLYINYNKKHI